MRTIVVIMAGGAGTRFWPLSTARRPKQFLPLLGPETLLQSSFERACHLTDAESVLVLTSEEFVPEVRRELPELPPGNVIGEPCRRDTAAAVALGALLAKERWGDPLMAVLTADHRIEPVEVFAQDVGAAAQGAAESGALYTLGVKPTHPATGYGYLELGELVKDSGEEGPRHYRLRSFREKPDRQTAEEFLGAGRFLWNSGMFVWQVSAIAAEYELYLPGHLEALAPALAGGEVNPELLRRAFASLRSVSVDYAVMERAARVHAVEARFDWDDLGGWPSLAKYLPADDAHNRARGRLVAHEARSNVVFSEDPNEVVALLGIEETVVVRAGERTLVVPLARCEEIKRLVEKLTEPKKGDGK